tara:strand:+ start:8610 stop:9533 length:924 start_codon:yes stop_codon:yes gene_type:complete
MRRTREIFSLSFLDIMACSFGAILMIILISNFNESEEPNLETLNEFRKAEKVKENQAIEAGLKSTINDLEYEKSTLLKQLFSIRKNIDTNENLVKKITNDIKKIKNPTINTRIEKDVSNIGGLKVDADYVIFIIDVSGSMIECGPWSKIVNEIDQLLDIFPDLKGFNVLTDGGKRIITGVDKWVDFNKTTKLQLKSLVKTPPSIGSASNPIIGLKSAISKYVNKDKVSIFILGDDILTSTRIEDEFKSIEKLLNGKEGLVSINAISFLTHYKCSNLAGLVTEDQNYRFMNLMESLTFKYNGSLIQSK